METEKKYFSVVTDAGTILMTQAVAEGNKVNITDFAVGDGGGSYYKPEKTMTALKNELWRGKINSCNISKESENVLLVSAVCPGDVGGFTIREMAIFDESNSMIAVCNVPETPKVNIIDGVVNEMYLEMQIALINGAVVELLVDPNIVTATKKDIEEIWKEIENRKLITFNTKTDSMKKNEVRFVLSKVPWEAISVYVMAEAGGKMEVLSEDGKTVSTSIAGTKDTTQLFVDGKPIYPETHYEQEGGTEKIKALEAGMEQIQANEKLRYALDKAIFCFIDDDGSTEFNAMYNNILLPRGIIGGMSICTGFVGLTGWMTADEINNYKNKGWSILNHSCDGDTLTIDNFTTKIEYAISKFSKLNIDVEKVLVWPNGNYAADKSEIENAAKKYFDYAVNVSRGGIITNSIPFESTNAKMDLKRIFADDSISSENIAWIKKEIDKTILNKGIFIVSTHARKYKEDILIEIIDYIINKGFVFTPPKTAFDIINNPQAGFTDVTFDEGNNEMQFYKGTTKTKSIDLTTLK